MNPTREKRWVRWLVPAVIPFSACALQWALWPYLQPFVWFMFLPASFASAWIGGLRGAVIGTGLSIALVARIFIPLATASGVAPTSAGLSVGGFALMGLLFGLVWERQQRLERRRAQDLEQLLDTLPAAVWISQDRRCSQVHVNAFARRLFSERSPEHNDTERQRWSPLRFLQNGRELASDQMPLRIAARTGRPVDDVELTVESADGHAYSLVGGATPLLDDAGRPRGAIAAFQDVSALRRAEAECRLGEDNLRRLVEGLPLLIWSCRADGMTDYLSPQWVRYTGIDAAEQIADGWLSLIHPDDRARAARAWAMSTACGEEFRVQCRIRRRDGEYRWFDTRAIRIPDRAPDGARWYGFSADFHDVREYLELSERHAKLIELSFDPVFAWNDRDGIVFWNRGSEQLYGYAEHEALGQNAQALLETHYGAPRDTVEAQLATGGQWAGDLLQTTRDGREIEVEARMQRIEIGDRVLVLETHRDITERARAQRIEREHRETERRLQSLISCLPGAVISYRLRADGSAHVGFASDGIRSIYGLDYSEVADDAGPIIDRLHPDDIERLKTQAAAARDDLQAWQTEFRVRHPLRGEIWVESMASPHREADGAVVFHCYHHDITARKQAEQALRESENRFATTFRANPCGLMIQRMPDGAIVDANDALLAIFGCTREHMLNRTPVELGLWATPERHAALLETCRATGRIDGEQLAFRHETGTIGSLLFSAEFVELSGQTCLISMFLDVTARQQAERALQDSESQQRIILDTAPVALGLLDAEGRILYLNKTFITDVDNTAKSLAGVPFADAPLFASDEFTRERVRGCIERGRRGEPSQVRLTHRISIDDVREIDFRLQPVFDAQGSVRALVPCALDLTVPIRQEAELRQRYEELSRVNAELVRATRLRDEFLATISHELRTPLTGVLTLSELMQRETYGPLTERQRHKLGVIESSGRHLLDLINDILDFARLQAGKAELDMQQVSLDSLCRETLWSIDGLAINKSIDVGYHINDPDARLRADPQRLRQMLTNLLGNAVKFTPHGGRIGLEVGGDERAGIAECSVWDTGIGISPEDMNRLCRPFTQLDGGLARGYSGAGIGLTLVQRLAEMHGGSISIASQPGQGSRFTLRLPGLQSLEHSSNDPVLGGRIGTGYRILLVDDDDLNLEIYQDCLAEQDFVIDVARNGVEALDALERRAPDLILMDIQMPLLNGLETTRKIRSSRDASIAAIPVIALTALVMPGDRDACLDAGCDDYLAKPVPVDVLLGTIARHLGSRRAGTDRSTRRDRAGLTLSS
ncbi:MAG: PAS domain S-box protein [Methylotetracoccus sp.]